MLTDRTVRGFKPQPKGYEVADGKTPGLSLRVLPSGSKRWAFRYRDARRRWVRMALGPWPGVGVADARELAGDHLRAIHREGRDPGRERREAKQAPTVRELADRFMVEHVEAKRKPLTADGYKRLLDLHVLPAIGDHLVSEVSRADVSALHYAMNSTPTQANRMLAVVSKMFNLAERWGLRPDGTNPARHVERNRERPSERFLSPAELTRLGEALAAAEGTEHPSALLAIRLLALTGLRRNEVLTLTWSAVDLEAGTAAIDGKTGPRTVRLPAPAVELLAKALRGKSNPHVCWGWRKCQRLVGLQRPWSRIRAAAGLEGVRLHDLRHSHAAVGAGLGLGLPIIGKLLGHTQAATTQRYAHVADDPLRQASERVGGEIAAALAGESGGEVVAIRGRR